MLSSLNLGVKTQKYFVSSSNMFLDKKTLFKIWLNPGLNLTIFRGTGPRGFIYRQRKGVAVGGEEFFFLALRPRFPRNLADVFEKNEKKNKTTSVYRLALDFIYLA